MHASALRVLHQTRARAGTWHGRHVASCHPEHKPLPFSAPAAVSIPRGAKRKHTSGVAAPHAALPQPAPKRRALGRCRLWLRVNVHRFAKGEDYGMYTRAMEDADERRRFDVAAAADAAAAAADANGPRNSLQRRRGGSRWTASNRELRKLRTNSKRARTQWNIQAARDSVTVLHDTAWHRRFGARSLCGRQQAAANEPEPIVRIYGFTHSAGLEQ